MTHPERSPERDAAIEALLDHVPDKGWSITALKSTLPDPGELEMLFPGGTTDLIETYCDLADRQMQADMDEADITGLGLTKRVRLAIALRLHRQRPHRDAVRRAASMLLLPQNAALSLRITARSVDAIWHAAGDTSADFSWYTKRAILAAVYRATLLYWLRDYSEDDAATLEFLDRRLAGVGRIGKARARVEKLLRRFTPGRAAEV